MLVVDSHCHLDFEGMEENLPGVLARAEEAPGAGWHWGPEAHHAELPRGERVHLACADTNRASQTAEGILRHHPGVPLTSVPHLVEIGHGEIYWFAVADAPAGGVDRDAHAELVRRFGGWHHPVRAVLEATDAAHVIRTDISDRDPVRQWHREIGRAHV